MDFEKALSQLTVEKIVEYANEIPDLRNDLVFQSYPHLLDFSKSCLANKNENCLIGIAHMVYGWMPTMLEYNQISNSDLFFKNVNNGSIEKDFLDMVKHSINNSIVGGSKFLHFLNPEEYAIFDSRVYKAITKSKSYDYNTNNVATYASYILRLRNIRDKAGKLRSLLIQKGLVSEKTSILRCIEMCLYYSN